MKRTLFALAVSLATAAPALAGGDHAGKIPWVTPEEGFQQAKMSGKPILLFFSADW